MADEKPPPVRPVSWDKHLQYMQRRIPGAMLRDREHVSKHILKLKKAVKQKRRSARHMEQELASLQNRLSRSIREREERRVKRPTIDYPASLPITARKDEIIEAVKKNPVIIVSGDTGSGKSTQIPKMCLDAGRGIGGRIGCTQPRRIAASTIARRIAEEMGETLGASVGYRVRFQDRTPRNAYIKILTDGMLLAETQQDPNLFQYDTLIIDEAHERTVNIDFLLGILKQLVEKRSDLRLIISSATLDTEKYARFFGEAPVFEVSGRTYPVEVEYLSSHDILKADDDIAYVDMAVRAVEEIVEKRRNGDILVFMPTEQDILETCEKLEGRQYPGMAVLPFFARLPWSRQREVYSAQGRKIVVATNVAETSLTIPGIRYVVDTGLARISQYMPATRTTSLPISLISQASADQRKGRCGRVQDGICIRLYAEDDFLSRPRFTSPEIMRANLAEVTLRMISLKLGDVAAFPFLDRPGQRRITDGFQLLTELGAVSGRGREAVLTPRGRLMAKMPLDPRISRMMIEARHRGCMEEVAIIAAALSIQDPRDRPTEKAALADQAQAPFKDPDSDFITLLNIWRQYHRAWEQLKTQNKMRVFCREHFLSFPRMREWIHVHDQIVSIMAEHSHRDPSAGGADTSEGTYARVHKSILAGFLSNIAMKKEKNIYLAARGREVMVFPGSSLFNKGTSWIVAAEMVKTSRLFARTTARIDPAWLEALGGELCKYTYASPHWEKKRGEVCASEQVALFGLVIISGRTVPFSKIDPEAAHQVFIQSALVEGAVQEPFGFLRHNRKVLQEVQELEEKVRRRGIRVSDDVLAEFYSERLPGVGNIRTLKNRIRKQGSDNFLRMTRDDLIRQRPDDEELARFPNQLNLSNRIFKCSYKFAPGDRADGVSLAVPSGLLPLVTQERVDWGVPGLFRDKITALVRGLPKRYRKLLVPISHTVDIIEKEMKPGHEALVATLSAFVFDRFGVDIPGAVWAGVDIPEHLNMRVSVVDHQGREIQSGRDVRLLTGEAPMDVPKDSSHAWKQAREKWEKDGLRDWDFGSLPDTVPVGRAIVAYPALAPGDDGVHLRLFPSAEQALSVHPKGVQRLFMHLFAKDLRFLKQDVSLKGRSSEALPWFGGVGAVENALYACLLKMLFQKNIRTQEAFTAYAQELRTTLSAQARQLRDQALEVLDAYSQARSTIHRIETAHPDKAPVLGICDLLRRELQWLAPGHFLEIYSMERLSHLPRYLKAIEVRAERGAYDPQKEEKKRADVAHFENEREKLTKDPLSPQFSSEKRKALDDFRWMIEEYKVSLFAQELKTPYPVSAKRLMKKIDEIKRMV